MRKSAKLFLLGLMSFSVVFTTAQTDKNWQLSPVEILNTPGDEYAPRIELLGLSYSRSPVAGEKDTELRTEMLFSAFRQNGFHTSRSFSEELSSPLHESSACLGPNGDFVIFSRNSPAKRNATNFLYISQAGVHDFQKAEPLPFNDPRFNTAHPAIDWSGKRLLFSSDRPGGFGGFDLYYAEFKDGVWSSAINLGEDVNSSKDEIFPNWSDNNQITFSSNRLGGYGGLDLYLLDASKAEWNGVKHLSRPFSSEGDDHGLTWSVAAGKGFLASNRTGGKGGDDLYSFTFSAESPIVWLMPNGANDQVVVLNSANEMVANLDEHNRWHGSLTSYPELEGQGSSVLAKRLCGTLVEGTNGAPDSIIMNQVRVEVQRSDFSQPLSGAVLRNPDPKAEVIKYTTDYAGGVCIPTPESKQSWIIEKQGFGPQSVSIDANSPFIALDLISNYPADSIVIRSSHESNRRLSASLMDKLQNTVSVIGAEAGYQLTSVALTLVSTQTPKTARIEAERLTSCVVKGLPVHPSVKVSTKGMSVYSDEGFREQSRSRSAAEARVEYVMLLRKLPSGNGMGLIVD